MSQQPQKPPLKAGVAQEQKTVTNPVPGAQVTKPTIEIIDQLMQGLGQIINSIPPFPSTQSASERLSEAHFWMLKALNDKTLYEKQMEEQKKSQASNEKKEPQASKGH